jgi:hypothetical protein
LHIIHVIDATGQAGQICYSERPQIRVFLIQYRAKNVRKQIQSSCEDVKTSRLSTLHYSCVHIGEERGGAWKLGPPPITTSEPQRRSA